MSQNTPVPTEYGFSTFIIEATVWLKQGQSVKSTFSPLYVCRWRIGSSLGDRIEYLGSQGWEFDSRKNNQF